MHECKYPHIKCVKHMPQELDRLPSIEILGLCLRSSLFMKMINMIAVLMFSEKQTALQIVMIKIKQENEEVIYIKVPDTFHHNGHYVLGISMIILNLLNDSKLNVFHKK